MKTIGIDGLNSSGKGTQIKLLQRYFDRNGINYLTLRGDGIRAGRGLRDYDLPSAWWRENASYLLDKSSDAKEKLNLQYQRLGREYALFEKKGDQEIILLDRCFPSRYFTMRQFFPDISLEEALTSYNPKTKKEIDIVIPDITIILDVEKKTLLERIKTKEKSNSKRRDIVRGVIDSNHKLFREIVEELRHLPGVYILDGEKNRYFLNKEILKIYEDAR